MSNSQVLTTRVSKDIADQLDAVATRLDRPRAWVIKRALENYLQEQEEMAAFIQEGIDSADRGELIPHEQVVAEMEQMIRDHQMRAIKAHDAAA